MTKKFDPVENCEITRKEIGYISLQEATFQIYRDLGFKCGLEIHQQLKTAKKLFCRCPAGIYQEKDEYDAEIVRHMRPTLSELGEYDGTALMEFKTGKNIFYHIKNETACTYEVDDTPPFLINREALEQAIEISLLLQTNIVGELHITRKQYLDGSIPTGFQRTAIVGIEGKIPLQKKKVGIIQLSIEEDACREVSDIGHNRVYTTDRLGMPLIEIVTYPDLLTPFEAAEAGNYLRYLTRSTNKVRTGIGAAREDVNVSISGGTRVEIKGVAHIKWIPKLTHIEAFRQKALLTIRDILKKRVIDADRWKITWKIISAKEVKIKEIPIEEVKINGSKIVVVNLPEFKGILSFFTQPGHVFADEISNRLKIIACLEKPNMTHSEDAGTFFRESDFNRFRKILHSGDRDGQIVFWGPEEDVRTALETIEERCKLAFTGVPNETRKSLPDGTTIFERVLPGPDRMYPDTDSAPISIEDEEIKRFEKNLPISVSRCMRKLKEWEVPEDGLDYILKKNLFPLLEKIIHNFDLPPRFAGRVLGQWMRKIERKFAPSPEFQYDRIYDMFAFVRRKKLDREIMKKMLPEIYQNPNMEIDSVLLEIGFEKIAKKQILAGIPLLRKKYREIGKKQNAGAEANWIMGELRSSAVGNIDLHSLKQAITGV